MRRCRVSDDLNELDRLGSDTGQSGKDSSGVIFGTGSERGTKTGRDHEGVYRIHNTIQEKRVLNIHYVEESYRNLRHSSEPVEVSNFRIYFGPKYLGRTLRSR